MASEAWPADPPARWSLPVNNAALLSAFEAQGVRTHMVEKQTYMEQQFQVILASEPQVRRAGGAYTYFTDQDTVAQKKVKEFFTKLVRGYWGGDNGGW